MLGAAESGGECLVVPCCYDALSAKMIHDAGFQLSFMTGFGVAAVRGMPDTGLLTLTEMAEAARSITDVVQMPLIADGDTGFGNAISVKRTVRQMAKAGAAAVMIEDQVAPKRCGYTAGKGVVGRKEAVARMQAAIDARDEGADILILARTDAAGVFGIDEAIERAAIFREMGADILHLSGPKSEEEMVRYCSAVAGPKMANNVSAGNNFRLPPARLAEIGYTLAIYPDLLLASSLKAMKGALVGLRHGDPYPPECMQSFNETKQDVGFADYDAEALRYEEGE